MHKAKNWSDFDNFYQIKPAMNNKFVTENEICSDFNIQIITKLNPLANFLI